MLVGAGGHQGVAKRLHLCGGILAGAQRGAGGNGVDEQANHGFRTRQVRRTARHHRAREYLIAIR